MKKSLMCVLCLCACAFAKEGDADELAGLVFLAFGVYVLLPCIMYAIVGTIVSIAGVITEAWTKLNIAGKIVVFGIPLFVGTTAILYGIIWTIIPEIYKLAHNIEFWIVIGVLYYISTYFTGYTNYSDKIRPRKGVYSKISRIILLTPLSPIWGPIYAIVKLFKVLFVAKQPAEHTTIITKSQTLNELTDVQCADISKIKNISNADKLLYDVAVWAYECRGISTSAVQRHFCIGFSRAGKIIDQLYQLRVIGPCHATTNKPRTVLMSIEQIMHMERCGKFS